MFFNWASMLVDQMYFFAVILQSYFLFLHCVSLWSALIVHSFSVCGCGMMFISADWFDMFLHCVSFFTGCVYGVFSLGFDIL